MIYLTLYSYLGTATLGKRDDQDDTDLAARQTAAAQEVLNKVPLNKVSMSYVGEVLLPYELCSSTASLL